MNSTFLVSLQNFASSLHSSHFRALPFFKNLTFIFSLISITCLVQCAIRRSLGWRCNLQHCILKNYHQKMTPPSSMEQPLLLNATLSGFQTHGLEDSVEDTKITMEYSGGGSESSMLMMELRNKILAFRDIIELPSYDNSSDLTHLAVRTLVDLHKLYPNMVRFNLSSETHQDPVTQSLVHLYAALKSVAKLWGLTNSNDEAKESLQNIDFDQLVRKLLAKLTFISTSAKEMFGIMDDDDNIEKIQSYRTVQKTLSEIYSRNSVTYPYSDASTSISPASTPTVKFEECSTVSSSQTNLQEMGNLKQLNKFPHLPAQNDSIVDETRETVSQVNAKDQLLEGEPKKVSFEGPKEHFNAKSDVPEIPKHVSDAVPEARDSSAVFPPPAPPPPPRVSPSSVKLLKETTAPSSPTLPLSKESEAPSLSPPPPPSGMMSPTITATLLSPSSDKLLKETATPSPPTIRPSIGTEALPPPPLAMTEGAAPPTFPLYKESEAPLPPPSPSSMLSPTITTTLLSPSSDKLLKETATPPPPTILPSIGTEALPPPSLAVTEGVAPPPPPPLSVVKIARLKRVASKLKRSTQMSNLYRLLKGKVEGSSLKVGASSRTKTKVGGSPKGKAGMAEALTEITKRSSYFKQIEEDVTKHSQLILELKAAITSFQTKDMDELIKFHKHVEQSLEKLTDETQVLPRFEGFPMKKLESLRAAAALYLKLKGILTDLQNWKVVPPLEQLLNKVESYFNKIKGELDTLERSKDDDSKQFQSNNIHFDFGILVQIKESLVDVSSSCMELALKEEREAAAAVSNAENVDKNKIKRKTCIKMLWRAFELAFRVYSFAGGQDDRADRLSMEVAQEIETDAQ